MNYSELRGLSFDTTQTIRRMASRSCDVLNALPNPRGPLEIVSIERGRLDELLELERQINENDT